MFLYETVTTQKEINAIKNKFYRSLNDFYMIIGNIILLGPKGLNDSNMKKITHALENNPDGYSIYVTLAETR